MSNRGLITKAWLTSFGDFLTLLLCVVIASTVPSSAGVTSRNDSVKGRNGTTQGIIDGSGTTVATSKELAALRAGFFDNTDLSHEVHDQLISVAKGLAANSVVDVELCADTSEAILQRAEILQGIFAQQKLRVYGTLSCANLMNGEQLSDVVALVKMV